MFACSVKLAVDISQPVVTKLLDRRNFSSCRDCNRCRGIFPYCGTIFRTVIAKRKKISIKIKEIGKEIICSTQLSVYYTRVFSGSALPLVNFMIYRVEVGNIGLFFASLMADFSTLNTASTAS